MLENCGQPEDQLSDCLACLQDPRAIRSICFGSFASIFGTLHEAQLIVHVNLSAHWCSGAVLLILQGCVLYDNWWPMLTMFFYVLIPMPYLFFGAGTGDGFYSSGMEVGYVTIPSHPTPVLLSRCQISSMLELRTLLTGGCSSRNVPFVHVGPQVICVHSV